jgi:hypothetical protein
MWLRQNAIVYFLQIQLEADVTCSCVIVQVGIVLRINQNLSSLMLFTLILCPLNFFRMDEHMLEYVLYAHLEYLAHRKTG